MPQAPDPLELNDLDFYRLIRARLEHEDRLIVDRLSWLLASQAFLFTAFAIVQNGPQALAGHQPPLLRVVVGVGISAVCLIYTGIFGAMRAMAWLRSRLRARVPDESHLGLLPVHTPAAIRAAGLAAPTLLPLVFLVAWIYLFVST